jgi:hypothetical protein
VKYLPLFHHFKAIYQFPKHIMFLVKIVDNTALTMTTRINIMVLLIRETLVFYGNWCWFASKKKLEDTNGAIRTRKSKERQCNGQKKTSKGTNNDPQITIKKTKERVTQKNVFLAGKQFLFH